jgi:hypothetical protein
MKTASYTELRNNLKSYLDEVINDSEPLIVPSYYIFRTRRLYRSIYTIHAIPLHEEMKRTGVVRFFFYCIICK